MSFLKIQKLVRNDDGTIHSGSASIVDTKYDLHNGQLSFLFTHTEFPGSFDQDIALLIQGIFVWIFDFIVEVGDIIIDHLGRATGFFHQTGIHSSDDLIFVVSNKGKGIVNIIRIETGREDRIIIIIILPYSGTFRCRVQQASKDQELCESIYIIFQFRKSFVGREECIQAQLFQYPFQQDMRKELRMSETIRTTFIDRKTVSLSSFLL